MAGWLEAISYGISRGIVRGYLDALRESRLAYEEQPTPVDQDRVGRFRDAVHGVLRDRDEGDPERSDPPPHL